VRPVGLAIATSIGLAAAAGFVYAPASPTRWHDQYRSTVLQIPRGTVELASFGTVDLAADGVTTIRAMHVRMIVSNMADDLAWTLDTSQVALDSGAAPIAATVVNSDVETLPIAIVGRGERAVVDLYFALPADCASDPRAFDVTWTLRTTASATSQRTRFSVDEMPSRRAGIALAAGWGRRWWFDRSYAWPSFWRRSGILSPRPPEHIAVARAAVRHEAKEAVAK
jgi:hypothetical protein